MEEGRILIYLITTSIGCVLCLRTNVLFEKVFILIVFLMMIIFNPAITMFFGDLLTILLSVLILFIIIISLLLWFLSWIMGISINNIIGRFFKKK